MKQFDRQEYLTRHIPHRLYSIAWFVQIIEGTSTWTEPKPLEVFIDGKRCIVGSHYVLTNPAIEVGILAARILIEFLGLRADARTRRLVAVDRRADDVGIEDFAGPKGFLSRITMDDVAKFYPGPPLEAEQSLVTAYLLANKGVAHLTVGLPTDQTTLGLLVHGAKGVRILTERFLYRRLGIDPPAIPIRIERAE